MNYERYMTVTCVTVQVDVSSEKLTGTVLEIRKLGVFLSKERPA